MLSELLKIVARAAVASFIGSQNSNFQNLDNPSTLTVTCQPCSCLCGGRESDGAQRHAELPACAWLPGWLGLREVLVRQYPDPGHAVTTGTDNNGWAVKVWEWPRWLIIGHCDHSQTFRRGTEMWPWCGRLRNRVWPWPVQRSDYPPANSFCHSWFHVSISHCSLFTSYSLNLVEIQAVYSAGTPAKL